jgi:glycosyltransferase involved in cell wall biosynthesis
MTRPLASLAPRVSVIMIFYNAERFIDEAIQSVRAQSFQLWELLLVDDGSRDGSTAIAERHAAADPDRIRLISHPNHENRGMSASRNLGLAHAQGEYVAFLDADDVWKSEQLSQQVKMLDAHPEAGAVYGRLVNWLSWPGSPWINDLDTIAHLPFPSGSVIQPPYMLPTVVNGGRHYQYFFGICSIMVRRTCIESIGGFNQEFRGLHEDNVFHIKLFLSTPVLVTDACWGWYRRHPQSAYQRSLRSFWMRLHADVFYATWLLDYLETVDVGDENIEGSIRQWAAQRRSVPIAVLHNPVDAFGPLIPRPIRRRLRPVWRTISGQRRVVLSKIGLA